MIEGHPTHQSGFAVSSNQPLIGVIVEEQGQEKVRYFTDEAAADAALLLSPRFLGHWADDNHAATSGANAARTAAGERWPWRPINHSWL
jgi:hypothetical protein